MTKGCVFIFYVLGTLLALYVLYIILLFLITLFIPKKEYEKESKFFRFLLNSSTRRILFSLRIHTRVIGLDKVPKGEKCLFVQNHISNYDPIVTWICFKPWHIAFVSKEKNFSVPVFGRIIRKCCFLPIDRKNIRAAAGTIRKAAKLLERREVSIGAYPEGKRSKDCTLLPFHDCMFRIAEIGNAPIVVLTIKGTENIFKNIKRFRRSDVTIYVSGVIEREKVLSSRSCEIGEEVRALMERDLLKEE